MADSDFSDRDRKEPPSYYNDDHHDVSTRDVSPDAESHSIVKDWSDAEEKRLLLKCVNNGSIADTRLDLIIMPLLTLAFFCMQMDRGNIGNALTNNFLEDLGITRGHYNIGQQLLYVGIVILELPSNLVLYRVGPRLWLGGQIVAWGFVETFQSFIHDKGSFYATRILLGMMEAGFIPAGLYCLSLWFKRAETSKRFTIFYFGNLVAQGATSLLAYGILRMDGIAGRHGWQWMFILEGIFTVLVGIVVILLLPDSPANPYPLTKLSYFTAAERDIMVRRIILDDPSKIKKSHWVGWKEIRDAFSIPRVYLHLVISMVGIASVANWLSYAPALVRGMGYSGIDANAFVSIGGFLQIPVSLFLGVLADKTKKRGLAVFIGVFGVWGFVLGDYLVHNSNSNVKRYAILIMTLIFSSTWQPINGSWLSINARSPAQRSVFFAMFVSATNIGGIWGSQLFQPDDAPRYGTGWAVILGLECFAVTMVIALNILYRWLNKRNKNAVAAGREVTADGRVKYWL